MALVTEANPTPCSACAMVKASALCGAYNVRCVRCCARLVMSARPNRKAQEGMLARITRRPENPKQSDILKAIKDHEK